MLALFHEHGFPSCRSGGDVELASYVFNGDFVDRGEQQVEVVALLFSLKVCFPDRVYLIRGNHEFRDMNTHMTMYQKEIGFDRACGLFFGPQVAPRVFESIHRSVIDLKATLPLQQQSIFKEHVALTHSSAPSIGCPSLP